MTEILRRKFVLARKRGKFRSLENFRRNRNNIFFSEDFFASIFPEPRTYYHILAHSWRGLDLFAYTPYVASRIRTHICRVAPSIKDLYSGLSTACFLRRSFLSCLTRTSFAEPNWGDLNARLLNCVCAMLVTSFLIQTMTL